MEQEAVALERLDHAVRGRAGDAGRLDDRGEGPRAALDRVDDREGAVEHADGVVPAGGRGVWSMRPARGCEDNGRPRSGSSARYRGCRVLFRSSEPSSTIWNTAKSPQHAPREPERTDDDTARTLAEKVWEHHLVRRADGEPDLLYVDLHLVHEVTSPQAFDGLRLHGRPVRRPDLTVATMDHNVPTTAGPVTDEVSARQMEALRRNAEEFGITLYPWGAAGQGIVHVIGPEMGYTQPGMTIVCGDSHTSTHGAFGALAFGIGTSRGRARPRDPDPAAEPAEVDGGDRRRRPARRTAARRTSSSAIINRIGTGRRRRPRGRVPRRARSARSRWRGA